VRLIADMRNGNGALVLRICGMTIADIRNTRLLTMNRDRL